MLVHSLWAQMNLVQFSQRALFFWCPPDPLALTLFLLPLPWDSLASPSSRGGIWERQPSRAVSFKVSLFLCNVWLWISVSVPVCWRRKLLRWQLNEALICFPGLHSGYVPSEQCLLLLDAGILGWAGGRKVGWEDLCDPWSERKERPQQVFCYRTEIETRRDWVCRNRRKVVVCYQPTCQNIPA